MNRPEIERAINTFLFCLCERITIDADGHVTEYWPAETSHEYLFPDCNVPTPAPERMASE